jgi:GntR family transcriptional repressor for pyruvate dehydrogenase complex
LTRNKKRLTLVQEEHQRIVQAIRDSDEEGARAAMRVHISNARIRALDSTAEPL